MAETKQPKKKLPVTEADITEWLKWERCPDCELRGDLDATGIPRWKHRARSIQACETCRNGRTGKGTGLVLRSGVKW